MESIQFESKLLDIAKHNKVLQNIIIVIFGSILLAVAAQITIPLQPIPITLQSFFALFVGMAFGPKMGGKIILVYLCEGACGLPVFSNFSGGIHILLGLRGGYLLGFIPASVLAGYLLRVGWVKHRITVFLAALFGTIVLFIPGYFVLSRFVGYQNAYLFGVAPFYLVEICKIAIFTVVTPFFWKR